MPDPLAPEPGADAAVPPRPGDAYVQSFARGLAVLRSFGADAPAQTLSTAAARSGMTRAGARRILLTLQQLGYVEVEGRLFRLTPKVLELGFAYLGSLPVWRLAQPAMEELVQDLRESCSAAVLDGDDIVYVLRVPANKIMAISLGVGSRLPAYCTSIGHVLLANLPRRELDQWLAKAELKPYTERTATSKDKLRDELARVREQDYAIADRLLEIAVRSIAVPVRNAGGTVVAGINVIVEAGRVSLRDMRTLYLPHLQAAATELGAQLVP